MDETPKLKILFVYDHEYPHFWKDGLYAALQLLKGDFEIEMLNLHDDIIGKVIINQQPEFASEKYDFVLAWGGFHSPPEEFVRKWKHFSPELKTGLCIGGNAIDPYDIEDWSIVFYETDFVKEYMGLKGNCVKAFGVNTDIYFLNKDIQKAFDTISVGAFASWKRHYELIGSSFKNTLAIGQIQRDNMEESMGIITNILTHGVTVSDMVSPERLAELYNMSYECYIPADIMGGGERAILEARACGIAARCNPDNPKLQELIDCDIPNEHDYYLALRKGIMSCL